MGTTSIFSSYMAMITNPNIFLSIFLITNMTFISVVFADAGTPLSLETDCLLRKQRALIHYNYVISVLAGRTILGI